MVPKVVIGSMRADNTGPGVQNLPRYSIFDIVRVKHFIDVEASSRSLVYL